MWILWHVGSVYCWILLASWCFLATRRLAVRRSYQGAVHAESNSKSDRSVSHTRARHLAMSSLDESVKQWPESQQRQDALRLKTIARLPYFRHGGSRQICKQVTRRCHKTPHHRRLRPMIWAQGGPYCQCLWSWGSHACSRYWGMPHNSCLSWCILQVLHLSPQQTPLLTLVAFFQLFAPFEVLLSFSCS